MHLPAELVNRLFPIRWLASILVIILVDVATYLAFRQSGTAPSFAHQDKLLHVIAFFGLTCIGHISLHYDFFRGRRRFSWPITVLNAAVWLAYGAFIEVMQGFLAHRQASMMDLLADAVGIAIGAWFVNRLKIYPREVADASR